MARPKKIQPSRQRLKSKCYKTLSALLRGFSISANPDYWEHGTEEALADLKDRGLIFLDVTGSFKDKDVTKEQKETMDPGDFQGRYRLVVGKQNDALDQIVEMDKQEKPKHKKEKVS